MKKKRNTREWKEKNIKLWERMVSIYFEIKTSPSAKLIIQFIALILKIVFSIVIRKIFLDFFDNFSF